MLAIAWGTLRVTMLLRLPTSLHYPITVTSLLKQPGDTVERDEALFWYVYETTVTEGDGLGNKVDVIRKFPAFSPII